MIAAMDSLSSWFPFLVPAIALVGLWIGRCATQETIRFSAERAFLALLLVVGGGTLRTIAANDSCWLLHTASLSIMIVGAIFPGGLTRPGMDSI